MTLLASAGLPWYVDPSFWTGLTFAAFAAILVRLAGAPLANALRARQSRIEGQLQQAEEAGRVVRELRLKQAERRRQAKIEAERMVEEAKRDAARTRRELVQRAGEDVQRLRLRARREIELAKRKAIHDLADRGAEVAVRVAEQTLLTRMTPADDDRLVQAALDEMARAAGGLQ